MAHTDALVVLTTVANADEAVQLIRALLDRRLVACGTMLPGARSLYRWEDKVADESEVVVLLKTRGAHDMRFVCLLAAPEGINHFQAEHPDVPIWTAAIDEKLNDHGYILPGLGDAGDRMYGTK